MRLDEVSFSSDSLIELIKSTLAKNSSFKFKVTGFSMTPFIKDNDIVTISLLSTNATAFGKAVAFIHSDTKKLVIHRIVGENNGCFIIKGDSVPEIDDLVPKENILGCVNKIERNARSIYLGLGPERLIIAFLSKNRLLPFLYCYRRVIPFFIRRFIKCRILL